jgi:hypothetical protein
MRREALLFGVAFGTFLVLTPGVARSGPGS